MAASIQGGKTTSFYLSDLECRLLDLIRMQEGPRVSKSTIIAKLIVTDAAQRGININEIAAATTIQGPAS